MERAFATDKGNRIRNASDLLLAIDVGFHVDWRELPFDEFQAVGVLKEERLRYEREQSQKED